MNKFDEWWNEHGMYHAQNLLDKDDVRQAWNHQQKEIDLTNEKLEKANALIEKMKEAVEFYGDEGSWEVQPSDQKCPMILMGEDISWSDSGGGFVGGEVSRQLQQSEEYKTYFEVENE